MIAIATLVLLVAAVIAALAPGRFATVLRRVAIVGLVAGLAGIAFLFYGPKDYLTRWPWLGGLFHPYQVILYAASALILGASAGLGLAVRGLIRRSTRSEGER